MSNYVGYEPLVSNDAKPTATIVDNTGTGDALVANFLPAYRTLTDNMIIHVVMSSPNTLTAPTINVNGLGIRTIVHEDGTSIVAGQLSGTITLRYESTSGNWRHLPRGYSKYFEASIGVSGYQRLPSGLIIQWGFVSLTAGTYTTVTFPIAFPNFARAAYVTIGSSTSTAVSFAGVNNFNTTSVQIASNTGTAIGTYWMAIGH
jgi:hypothetical protein